MYSSLSFSSDNCWEHSSRCVKQEYIREYIFRTSRLPAHKKLIIYVFFGYCIVWVKRKKRTKGNNSYKTTKINEIKLKQNAYSIHWTYDYFHFIFTSLAMSFSRQFVTSSLSTLLKINFFWLVCLVPWIRLHFCFSFLSLIICYISTVSLCSASQLFCLFILLNQLTEYAKNTHNNITSHWSKNFETRK